MIISINRIDLEKLECKGIIFKGIKKIVIGFVKIKLFDFEVSFSMVYDESESRDDKDEYGLYCKCLVDLEER